MSQAPAGGRRTVVGGARVVSGAEKKYHLIEAAPFGRLDQMLRAAVGDPSLDVGLPPPSSPRSYQTTFFEVNFR